MFHIIFFMWFRFNAQKFNPEYVSLYARRILSNVTLKKSSKSNTLRELFVIKQPDPSEKCKKYYRAPCYYIINECGFCALSRMDYILNTFSISDGVFNLFLTCWKPFAQNVRIKVFCLLWIYSSNGLNFIYHILLLFVIRFEQTLRQLDMIHAYFKSRKSVISGPLIFTGPFENCNFRLMSILRFELDQNFTKLSHLHDRNIWLLLDCRYFDCVSNAWILCSSVSTSCVACAVLLIGQVIFI